MTTSTITTAQQTTAAPTGASTKPLSANRRRIWSMSKINNARFKPGAPLGGSGLNSTSSSCDGGA